MGERWKYLDIGPLLVVHLAVALLNPLPNVSPLHGMPVRATNSRPKEQIIPRIEHRRPDT